MSILEPDKIIGEVTTPEVEDRITNISKLLPYIPQFRRYDISGEDLFGQKLKKGDIVLYIRILGREVQYIPAIFVEFEAHTHLAKLVYYAGDKLDEHRGVAQCRNVIKIKSSDE